MRMTCHFLPKTSARTNLGRRERWMSRGQVADTEARDGRFA